MPSKIRALSVRINGKSYRVHRLIWEAVNGSIPDGHVIHHIDGNPLNNDIANLACMTNAEHVRLHRQEDGAVPPSQAGRKRELAPIVCAHCGITALRSAGNHIKHGERYCSRACGVAAANKRRKSA
jgi:hypothetical protein